MIMLAVFNYLIIYRRNKFIGSLGYLLFGILLFGVKEEFAYSEALYGYIALFIFAGALINLIYEVLSKLSKGGTKPMRRWFSKGR